MGRLHDEFFKQNGTEHDELALKLMRDGSAEWILRRMFRIEPDNVTSEMEKLCKSGYVIIGYADFVINAWYNDSDERYLIICEIKPRVSDWGAVVRQLKTYMDLLRKEHGVVLIDVWGIIITKTIPDLDIRKFLLKEKIAILAPCKRIHGGN